MSKKSPLERLKHGLSVFRKQLKARKDDLLARITRKEQLLDVDEAWLDNDANDVDEVQVIDKLDNASDYDRGLARLNSREKGVVQRLLELAGDIVKKPANKRKRPEAPARPEKPNGTKAPVFTKPENATLQQRVEILDWHNANGKNQTRTARHWDKIYPNLQLKQPLISKWVKREEYWRNQLLEIQAQGGNTTAKRVRQTENPQVDEMLELWVHQAMSDGIHVTGEVLRQTWKKFADRCCIPEDDRVQLSEGWLARFKTRTGLKGIKRHGEAASADLSVVEKDRERIRALIRAHGYRAKDIFNMDETGLFYGMPPDRGLADRKMSGVKGKKTRLTYAFTMNADGSEKREPVIIGRWNKPRCFEKKTGAALGFYYRHNAKAWMTTVLFTEWVKAWDAELRLAERKILLFLDNFSAHIELRDELTNIKIEFFSPNITSHIQPADAGIIRCFKAHYRRRFIERAMNRYDSGVSPSQIYDINQLEAMRIAALAWRDVDTTTIRNCWRKVNILPDDISTDPVPAPSISVALLLNPAPNVTVAAENVTAAAENAVAEALDALEQSGAIHPRNRIAIEDLLNPSQEGQLLDETSEEQIFEAVMDRRRHEQDIELNGGDDGPREDDEEVPPSQKEALAAALLLQKFAGTMGSQTARALEDSLLRFCREQRANVANNLRTTSITDYFSRI